MHIVQLKFPWWPKEGFPTLVLFITGTINVFTKMGHETGKKIAVKLSLKPGRWTERIQCCNYTVLISDTTVKRDQRPSKWIMSIT